MSAALDLRHLRATTRSGVPFRRHVEGMPNVGQGNGWTTRQWRKAPVKRIRLTSLISINPGRYLNERVVNHYMRAVGDQPCVIQHGGNLYVADGHHRVVAAWRRGETHIRAHVIATR